MGRHDLTLMTEFDNKKIYEEGVMYPTRDIDYEPPFKLETVKAEVIQPVQRVVRNEYNPFEDIFKRKMKKDFEDYLTSSENIRIEQKIRELEKKGVISIYYDKLDKSDIISLRPKEEEKEEVKFSEKTKAFLWGLATGIGIMIMLL